MVFISLVCGFSCIKTAPQIAPGMDTLACSAQFPDMHVTYDGYVKNIIEDYCTNENCHQGGSTEGPGNFTSFKGLKPYANRIFYFRVIQDNADMPEGKAPLPKRIRDSLNIWIKNCSPEN